MGDFTARDDGVVAGLLVAEAVVDVVCGGAAQVVAPVSDGARVRAGDVLLTVTAPTRALLTAERTALNLLCHLSGVATADRAVGRRDRRHRRTRPRHPQDHARAARPGEVRRALRRRRQPPDGAVRRGPGQGQPRGRRGRGARRPSTRSARCARACRSRSRSTPSTSSTPCSTRAPTWSCSTTSTSRRRGPRSLRTAGRARLESSGGLSLDVARAYAETGVDYLAVGALTHSAPVLDIGLDLRPLGSA